LAGVLNALGSPPDFESSASLRFKHRKSEDADIYFVANPKAEPLATRAAFRVGDKAPELWWPDSGRIERPAVYEVADGVVRLPLSFGPTGSVFVVFRKKAAPAAEQIVSVRRNGGGAPTEGTDPLPFQLTRDATGNITARGGQAGEYQLKFASGRTLPLEIRPAESLDLTGPWDLRFDHDRGAPEKTIFDPLADWTKRPEDDIKYFSGKATYYKTFEVAAPSAADSVMILDLGEVHDLATVRLNGQELATLWLPPYHLDITTALKPGTNALEIDVVNPWNNRLVGDAALPVERRRTALTSPTVTKDTPLKPAGLLGPVMIHVIPPAILQQ
jgi:hypothetical protein